MLAFTRTRRGVVLIGMLVMAGSTAGCGSGSVVVEPTDKTTATQEPAGSETPEAKEPAGSETPGTSEDISAAVKEAMVGYGALEEALDAMSGEPAADFPTDVPLVDGEVTAGGGATVGLTSGWVAIVSITTDCTASWDEATALLEGAGYSSSDAGVAESGDYVMGVGSFVGPHMVSLNVMGDGANCRAVYSIDSQ